MADQRPTNKERVKEIVAGIEQNIQELFLSERYFDYLRTMSRFHHYSTTPFSSICSGPTPPSPWRAFGNGSSLAIM